MANVNKTDTCWLWTRAANGSDGYGYVCFGKLFLRTHVLSYMLAHELTEKPEFLILHTCDTPLCVRPEHLFGGDQEDNMKDKMKKGRWHGKGGTNRCDFTLGSHSDNRRKKLSEDAKRRYRAAKEKK